MLQHCAFTTSVAQRLRATTGHATQRRRAQKVAVVSELFTSEQASKSMEFQLKRSQTKASQSASSPAPTQPERVTEDDLQARKKAAREWITPWLEQTARKRSQEAMAGMRGRVELLSKEQEQLALSRLVGQTAPQGEEPAPASVPDESANGAAAGEETQVEQPASKYAPTEVLDDGSVIYSVALLQSVDYEAVLAP